MINLQRQFALFPTLQLGGGHIANLHAGFYPDRSLIEVKPDQDLLFDDEEICRAIEKHGGELALVLLPGAHAYTGQCLDLAKICNACHSVVCVL